jgi:hypothetical protein
MFRLVKIQFAAVDEKSVVLPFEKVAMSVSGRDKTVDDIPFQLE